MAVGEAIHHRQAEGGGAPCWVQPTCGTSSGSSGWRIQAPLEGSEALQEGTTELPPALTPLRSPQRCPGSPGTGGL